MNKIFLKNNNFLARFLFGKSVINEESLLRIYNQIRKKRIFNSIKKLDSNGLNIQSPRRNFAKFYVKLRKLMENYNHKRPFFGHLVIFDTIFIDFRPFL